jgi:hypothetical protein
MGGGEEGEGGKEKDDDYDDVFDYKKITSLSS